MNKFVAFLTLLLSFGTIAMADQPDFSRVWEEIRNGHLQEAKQIANDMLVNRMQECQDNLENCDWEKPFEERPSITMDTQEHMHYFFVIFYITCLESKDVEMQKIGRGMSMLMQMPYFPAR